jgi:hypothetical protein
VYQTRLKLSWKVNEFTPLRGGRDAGGASGARREAEGEGATQPRARGRVVQVHPNKPTLKATGTERLKLTCDEPLANFALKSNSRR